MKAISSELCKINNVNQCGSAYQLLPAPPPPELPPPHELPPDDHEELLLPQDEELELEVEDLVFLDIV